ncbi:MAG: PH domain-containing protein [Bacilli bacterium]
MEYKNLNKKAVNIMVINAAILLIVTSFILFISYFIYLETNLNKQFSIIYLNIVTTIITIYLFLNVILFPTIRYKRYQYLVDDDKIDIKKGLFIITRTIVPIVKVQKIAISNGPIDRLFGLSNVAIYTAAGVVKINFLEDKQAYLLCEEINKLLDMVDKTYAK